MLVLEKADVLSVIKWPYVDSMKVVQPDWIKEMFTAITPYYGQLRIGLGTLRDFYLPYVLLVISDGEFQRVQIEKINCTHCQSPWLSANPAIWDLYISVPNKDEAWEVALSRTQVKCPHCGQDPGRRSIWLGRILEAG